MVIKKKKKFPPEVGPGPFQSSAQGTSPANFVTSPATPPPTATQEAQKIIQAREVRANVLAGGATVPTRRQLAQAFADVTAGERGGGVAISEDIRREQFQQATSSDVLRQELEAKIAQPPNLEPEPIGERVAEVGLQPAVIGGNLLTGLAEKVTGREFGRQTPEELAKTTTGKALGVATVGVGIAAAAALAAPYVAALAARSAIFKGVTGAGGSVPALRTAIEGVGLFLVGRGLFDFRGDEMDNLRQGLKKVVEDGERIEAANRNGFPSSDTIALLTIMSEEVSFAEQRIKELGNNNVNYRVSREYILDAQNARSAREAILRRVLAVENIAATGQAQFDPEALLYTASQF